MNIRDLFGTLAPMGVQQQPENPLYNRREAGWAAAGGALQGLGTGLMTGDWAKALEVNNSALDQYQQNKYRKYTAQQLMEEAAAKKAEREQAAQQQQWIDEQIAQLPPDQQALAKLMPDKFFGAQIEQRFAKPDLTTDMKNFKMAQENPAYAEFLKQQQASGGGGSNWGMSAVPVRNRKTGEYGVGQFNQGQGGLFVNGQSIAGTDWEPFDPFSLNQQKAAGTATGTQMGGAAAEIPGAQIDTNAINSKIDMLINNPNLGDAIGYGNVLGDYFVGNDTLEIRSQLNELEGGAFLSAYSALKGAGQITEIESAQAKQAIADMQTARKMSDKDKFVSALERFREAVNRGMDKIRAKAGPFAPSAPSGDAGGAEEWTIGSDGKPTRVR